MSQTEPKKRTRAPRRNFERILADLRQFIEVSVEVYEGLGIQSDALKGEIVAYKRILLSRIEGGK